MHIWSDALLSPTRACFISASLHPTSATTEHAVPVVVVGEPFNAWDVAAVIIGLIVGVLSVFLAGKALQIGRQANKSAAKAAEEAERANLEASRARAAVVYERRRALEIEMLCQLLSNFDMRFRNLVRGDQDGGRALEHCSPLLITGLLRQGQARLGMIPYNELQTWRDLEECQLLEEPTQCQWEDKIIATAELDEDFSPPEGEREDLLYAAIENVCERMQTEVTMAIHLRSAARDE